MKRLRQKAIIIISIITATTLLMAGCGSVSDAPESGRISIVTTGFPEYDWTREMLAGVPEDEYELTMLLADGIDMHSYQPSAKDIVTISEADMFVYGGGESDEWIDEVLAEAGNDDMLTVNLMDIAGAVEEEDVEGMQEGREEESDEPEYDEHTWLSLENAEACCREIAKGLNVLLPGYQDAISDHCSAYCESLGALKEELQNAVNEADCNTLICCDRFPFRYLMDEFGIDYYAAFPGCSTEADASFETILFLADKVDELGVQAVVLDTSGDDSLAKTVIKNTKNKDAEILRLNSMQAVTQEEADGGISYLGVMADNAEVIRKVLSIN